jgi:hypothetical protein
MGKKGKSKIKVSEPDLAKDLWINPRSNMKGPDGYRAWENRTNISPDSGARFLELADIALGLKKPATSKKKSTGVGAAHQTTKEEPYSREDS